LSWHARADTSTMQTGSLLSQRLEKQCPHVYPTHVQKSSTAATLTASPYEFPPSLVLPADLIFSQCPDPCTTYSPYHANVLIRQLGHTREPNALAYTLVFLVRRSLVWSPSSLSPGHPLYPILMLRQHDSRGLSIALLCQCDFSCFDYCRSQILASQLCLEAILIIVHPIVG
jgi:hypothetical protein